jgi:type IV pilus assembly protein PilX
MNSLPKKQQGAALFVALIFLLILTVLGVSSMSDTVMQGKMSAAIQDGNIALQGAETAVRAAEATIDGFATLGAFNNTNGLYIENNAPDPHNNVTWTGTNSVQAGAVNGLAEAPRFFIELAGDIANEDSDLGLNLDTYSHESGAGQTFAFRIVAQSSGGSSAASRMIETYYARVF